MDNYEMLANAIIIQAVKDYKSKYRRLLRTPKDDEKVYESVLQDVNVLEKFFLSDWFELLTNADGKLIIKRIKKEEDEKYELRRV